MKRSPMRQRYRPTGPDAATVELVLQRDGHACVRCMEPVRGTRGEQWVIHHRQPRAMGGTALPAVNSPSNLVTLCAACHLEVESRRAEALNEGYLVSKFSNPATVAVLLCGSRWRYLSADGHYEFGPAS